MRELRPALVALIQTGRVKAHSTVDIDIPDSPDLHYSSGELYLNAEGVERQYQSRLDSVGALTTSVLVEVDQGDCGISNADSVFGQTVLSASNVLSGNRATLGTLFINPDVVFASGGHFLDPKFESEIVTGDVSEETVALQLVGVLDSVSIPGRTIASEFPWREPISTVPDTDPNDLIRPVPIGGGGSGLNGRDIFAGRWPMLTF